MPVKRITSKINLRKSDSVILIYGQVNDIFATEDLSLYNIDGIEKILCRYLLSNGFEQVVFYAPERQLYAYDQQSRLLCFPQSEPNTSPSPEPIARYHVDRRPLAGKSLLKPRRTNSNLQAPSTHDEATWHQEGFIPIVSGKSDVAIVDILRNALFQSERKSAVIFSQFDDAGNGNELQRLVRPLIPRLQRRTNQNKCIIISNAVDEDNLREVINSVPALSTIVKMGKENKGLDSLVYIGYPHKDEIRNYFHRLRIVHETETDWSVFPRIITHLDQSRNVLKKWDADFRDIKRIDLVSVNEHLTKPIDKDHQSGLRRLEELIGLEKAKLEIKRHLLQIQDLRENNPNEKPLMHICLKGNPGTGKTTIARIMADIFREANLLERGHLIEVDRQGLVAGYVGQTAITTDNKCREALDGVLFVDEAYALAAKGDGGETSNSQDFGQEAIDTLIKRMSDWQNSFCVILAGYPEDMDNLLSKNAGFDGRIGLTIELEDYGPEELTELFQLKASSAKKVITSEFIEILNNIFTILHRRRGKKFDNARTVEKIFAKISGKHIERCLKEGLDRRLAPLSLSDIPDELARFVDESAPEEVAIVQLESLVGLTAVKQQIKRQIAMMQAGFSSGRRLHLIFKGNPGTGKTTVARLLGRIYQDHQILSNNVFIEASRQDLVGSYQGQTAKKVAALCKMASGGILFIDEVYALVQGENDTYGREAVDTLLKIVEDQKEDLCVILAGYPNQIDDFLETNPGLHRRFPTQIIFEDYTPEELTQIFELSVQKRSLILSDEVSNQMPLLLKALYDRRDENFGNAGTVENMIQGMLENFAVRCLDQELELPDTSIEIEDVPDSLVKYLPVDNSDEIIDNALFELKQLVGLKEVKSQVQQLVREYRHAQKMHAHSPSRTQVKRAYHMLFRGNPGTGKTTVARIIGKIFNALDILKDGEVVEVSRSDFVGAHLGETAIKSKKLIRRSFDKVLFIDEAYSLITGPSDSYGNEAITVLLKMMEDHRDRLVVIAAGYPREMRSFLRSNSGLSARFAYDINFADYSDDESVEIFKMAARKRGYQISSDTHSLLSFNLKMNRLYGDNNYGNARDIIKFLETKVLPSYIQRVENLNNSDPNFRLIIESDIPTKEERIGESSTSPVDKSEDFSVKEKLDRQRNASAQINQVPTIGRDYIAGNQIITNNYSEKSKESLPYYLNTFDNVNETITLGRAQEVTAVFNFLQRDDTSNSVLVHGAPGIGKTKMVAQFTENYKDSFDHLIWLEVNSDLPTAFIESNLNEQLGIDHSAEESASNRFREISIAIRNINARKLLVLDNVGVKAVSAIKNIDFPNTKIIVISREEYDFHQKVNVLPLSREHGIKLFLSLSKATQINESELDVLLHEVSYHPLAIELLASIFREIPDKDVEQLTQDVRDGMHLLRNQQSESDEDNHLELIEVFQSLFKLWELSELEREYLNYFSLIPSIALPYSFIKEIFSTDQVASVDQTLISLQKKGLIHREDKLLRCHAIIQRVCREGAEINEKYAGQLLTSLGVELGKKIDIAAVTTGLSPIASVYLPLLEKFIEYFSDEKALALNRITLNLSILSQHIGEFDAALYWAERTKSAISLSNDTHPHWYCAAIRKMAFAKTLKKDYLDASELLKTALDFTEEYLLEPREHRSAVEKEKLLITLQFGELYLRPGRLFDLEIAANYFEKTSEILNGLSANYPLINIALKQGQAGILIEIGKFDGAVELLETTKKILIEELNVHKNSLSVGRVECSLALAYSGALNFTNANLYNTSSKEILSRHLPTGDPEMIRLHNVMAVTTIVELQHKRDQNEYNYEDHIAVLDQAEENIRHAISLTESYNQSSVSSSVPDTDLALMHSNYGLILLLQNKEEEGYKYALQSIKMLREANVKNVLLLGLYIRVFLFFGEQTPYELVEEGLKIGLDIIPEDFDHLVERSFINYCYGMLKHEMDNSRDGVELIYSALEGIRDFHGKGKISRIKAEDSPLEVVCLEEIAKIYSAIDDHRAAIKAQQEALEICSRNMDEGDEDMFDRYLIMCEIYLKSAEQLAAFDQYALALEYRQKASRINSSSINNNKSLMDFADIYIIPGSGENEKRSFIVVPEINREDFTLQLSTAKKSTLSNMGYLLPVAEGEDVVKTMERLTEKYGRLNVEFVKS